MARPGAYGLLETSTRASRRMLGRSSSTRRRRYSPAGTRTLRPSPPRCGPSRRDKRPAGRLSVDAEGDVVQEEAPFTSPTSIRRATPSVTRQGPGHVRSPHRGRAQMAPRPARDAGSGARRRSDCCCSRATCRRPPPRRICALGHDLQTCPQVARSRASLLRPVPRARSTILLRVAAPPPDLGLTNSTGRRGGSAVRQPRLISVGSRGAGCGGRFMSQLPSSRLSCASSLATLRLGVPVDSGRSKAGSPGSRLGCGRFARRSLGQGGRRTPTDNASRHHHTHLTFAACGFH